MTALEQAATIAARCQQARRIGDRWQCLCPSHDDMQASLSITAKDDRVLLHCHAGCETRIILMDLGLTERDLFASRNGQAEAPKPRIVTTYDYHTVDGHLLFQTVRLDPKNFRQRRPDPAHPGQWLWNLQGIEPVLYTLPQVLRAVEQGQTISLCEGEKDADNLHALGLPATTAPMGAGKWRPSYTETLRGAVVVILPDNDAPGRQHAELVARSLHGVAASVKVLALPGLPEKGDVSDWLHAGGTRAQLEAMVKHARLWTPPAQAKTSSPPGMARQLRVTRLATVMPERVHWLWKPYLPLGRPVALEGDPGIGKSSLVAKIAAHLTSGTPFPNVIPGQAPQPCPACNVCLLTAEDDPGDTILPRVAVNGGDPACVYLIDGWQHPDGAQGHVTMKDLDLLQQALEHYTPRLMVFDPVQSFFGRGIDMNHASDTRPVLDAVVALCKQHGCTPLFVRHIGKARRDKALYAGLGSIDITAAMRSVLFLGQDPENEQRRILAQSKANNARLGPSLAYRIVSVDHDLPTPTGDLVTVEAPRLDWDGMSPLTATDLASPPLINEEEGSALDQARAFLRELLADGPMLADEVHGAAKHAGIALRTLRRAKPLEDVQTRRQRHEDTPSKEWPWEWYLPDAESRCSTPSTHSVGHLGLLENIPTKSSIYEDTSRWPSGHLETEPQRTENQLLALEGLDGQATYEGEDTAPEHHSTRDYRTRDRQREQNDAHTHDRCPKGGNHTWLTRGDGRLCSRCNAHEPTG